MKAQIPAVSAMSDMAELCEPHKEWNDLQVDVVPGEGDLPKREAGGGRSQEMALSATFKGALLLLQEEGYIDEERESGRGTHSPRQCLCSRAAGRGLKELDDWKDDSDYQKEELLSSTGTASWSLWRRPKDAPEKIAGAGGHPRQWVLPDGPNRLTKELR